ncbi:MAG: transposase, partial [Actinomycetota bacterium]|nr:transposase [Actinomycetota bacterium]
KQLEQVERAFRTLKGAELEIRPIHHRLDHRVRAHIFLCTLAYYLTWHLKAAWAPLLFKDEQPPTTHDPVAKADRSPAAQRKATSKRTADDETCHSYKTLLAELATLTRNTIRLPSSDATFDKLALPTQLQARALDLAEHAPVTEK